jgi:hypothetical protein
VKRRRCKALGRWIPIVLNQLNYGSVNAFPAREAVSTSPLMDTLSAVEAIKDTDFRTMFLDGHVKLAAIGVQVK